MIGKKLLLSFVVGLVVAGSVLGAGYVSAQDAGDGHATFVQKLAEKLGISQDTIKTALDEIHTEHHAQMLENMEEKLDQAVADRKINEVQKEAILQKFAEMKKNKPEHFEEYKDMTPEQRKQAMEQKKEELESWAEENGLTLETFHELLGGPHKGMFFRIHK